MTLRTVPSKATSSLVSMGSVPSPPPFHLQVAEVTQQSKGKVGDNHKMHKDLSELCLRNTSFPVLFLHFKAIVKISMRRAIYNPGRSYLA